MGAPWKIVNKHLQSQPSSAFSITHQGQCPCQVSLNLATSHFQGPGPLKRCLAAIYCQQNSRTHCCVSKISDDQLGPALFLSSIDQVAVFKIQRSPLGGALGFSVLRIWSLFRTVLQFLVSKFRFFGFGIHCSFRPPPSF